MRRELTKIYRSNSKKVKDYVFGVPKEKRSLVFTGPTEEFGVTAEDKKRANIDDLEFYTFNDPLVFVGTQILWPQSCLGKGYFIDGSNGANEEAVKLCKHIVGLQTFKPSLLLGLAHGFSYGDGYLENIWKGDEITGFDIINPKSIKPSWDEKGQTTKFVQKTKSQSKKVDFDPGDITHVKLFQIGDSVKGIGLVEPLLPILWVKREMEKSMAEIVWRWANPFLHMKKTGAIPSEIRDMERKAKDFNRRTVFGSSEKYSLEIIGAKQSMPDLSPLYDYILKQVCSGLRIPMPILLAAGERVNRATLDALISYNANEISLIQESKISRIVESQIFRPAMDKAKISGEVPDMKWNPLSSEDEKMRSQINANEIEAITKAVKANIIPPEDATAKVKEILGLR